MTLSDNTAALQSVLELANNLPDAGSGGGGVAKENALLTIACRSENSSYLPTIFYSCWDGDVLRLKHWTATNATQSVNLTVALGHLIFITCMQDTSGYYGVTSYTVRGDGVVAVDNFGNDSCGGAYQMPAFLISGGAQVTFNISCYAAPPPDYPKIG